MTSTDQRSGPRFKKRQMLKKNKFSFRTNNIVSSQTLDLHEKAERIRLHPASSVNMVRTVSTPVTLVGGRVSCPRSSYHTKVNEPGPTRRWLAWSVCQKEGIGCDCAQSMSVKSPPKFE
ncbi:hypothetical protein Y032_0256g346 [Ancylostoma ceylanicum]|uniref:Uncharacterized protein n=1 Tax=Ancylostoma ceylanicum TaxID=53326 RepID=A0A016SBZ2_9BILA|nr:hypothetical protein Y032_0256g346 [Ancylostoma ceylanicum]